MVEGLIIKGEYDRCWRRRWFVLQGLDMKPGVITTGKGAWYTLHDEM